MIKVGQKVRINPFTGLSTSGNTIPDAETIGKIIYVNYEHRYFTVEYNLGDQKAKLSYKFNDVYGLKKIVHFVN